MPELEGMKSHEEKIIKMIESEKKNISNKTGKGMATEDIVSENLVEPYLPPRFDTKKGSIVTPENPNNQSAVIDRIIYDREAGPPLYLSKYDSVFPIEVVSGLIEITMFLTKTKMKNDMQHMATVKKERNRRYYIPHPTDPNLVIDGVSSSVFLRSYIIGLPSKTYCKAKTIAKDFGELQIELSTHVHGLYVIGVGYFVTMPPHKSQNLDFMVKVWDGNDRLFRFSNDFRQSFDRWPIKPKYWTVNLDGYAKGEPYEIIKIKNDS